MKVVALTQRVSVVPAYDERRDCLDQAWTKFLSACGLLPLLLPNVTETALALCEVAGIAGLVLTGGNDLAELGGDAPERDVVEYALLDWAERRGLPVLGVCRGMQVIQQRFAIPLRRVEGHVAKCQVIRIDGRPCEVNSYHHFAAFDSRPPLDVWAVADDGAVKAIRHSAQPITGIMWHPERCSPFSPTDVALFRGVFRSRLMRAIILAAGRGSRMGHLTGDRPKCFIELAGQPLIVRQIAALRRGGVDEVGVVRGYRAEMIDFPGLAYFSNERWAETNMVMSLAAAAAWLRSGPAIVSYGDIFYRSELVRGLAGAPGQLIIAYDRAWRRLWSRRFADPLADAETFGIGAAGQLLEIGGRTTRIEDIQGQYMGLLKFTPPAWRAVEALLGTLETPIRDRLDVTGLLRRLLAGKVLPISTFPTDGHWGEIDNPEDVALYQEMVREGDLQLEET